MKNHVKLILTLLVLPYFSYAQFFGGQLKPQEVSNISALDCNLSINSGTLTEGVTAVGVNSVVPYSGGDGSSHNGQTVNSTGVIGLTATLTAGTFANGSGSLTYTISGTPASSGSASFALSIGGQTCTLTRTVNTGGSGQYPVGSVFCASGPTAIVEVTNPITGKTWMDRNLGASQLPFASSDGNAIGALYQWGRRNDGHQCRNSPTLALTSSSDQGGAGFFIIPASSPFDWRNPQNSNLWQGVNGVNNPCPAGFRLPTQTEWQSEFASWGSFNSSGAFASLLKLTVGGNRSNSTGAIAEYGSTGNYWSSTVTGNNSIYLRFSSITASTVSAVRARGNSVRCIKD